jgi:hypothetical protein
MSYREKVWNKLSHEWKPDSLEEMATEISLSELDHKIDLILKGQLKGRTVLNLAK